MDILAILHLVPWETQLFSHFGKGLVGFYWSHGFLIFSSLNKKDDFKLHDSVFERRLGSSNQTTEHWSVSFHFFWFSRGLSQCLIMTLTVCMHHIVEPIKVWQNSYKNIGATHRSSSLMINWTELGTGVGNNGLCTLRAKTETKNKMGGRGKWGKGRGRKEGSKIIEQRQIWEVIFIR